MELEAIVPDKKSNILEEITCIRKILDIMEISYNNIYVDLTNTTDELRLIEAELRRKNHQLHKNAFVVRIDKIEMKPSIFI